MKVPECKGCGGIKWRDACGGAQKRFFAAVTVMAGIGLKRPGWFAVNDSEEQT